MKIISFLTSKGGAGKSTTALNVARGLQLSGSTVSVFDTDVNQQTAAQWRQDADDSFFSVDVVDPADVPAASKAVKSDYLIIDGAGSLDKHIVTIANVSNLIIIPVQPSALDYWPAARLFDLLKPLNITTAYLLTQARKRTTMTAEMINTLSSEGSSFDSVIHARTSYQLSIGRGQTVYECDKVAAAEIDAVINEIKGAI